MHPAVTTVLRGSWSVATVLHGLELLGEKRYAGSADTAMAVGLVGEVGAALTGLTDWTGTTEKRRKVDLMHGLLNFTATGLYATSLPLHRN